MTPRAATGFAALGLFTAMALVLQWKIAPLSGGFLPQATPGGYSDADLLGFAQAVGRDPVAATLYVALLRWVDPAFILCFAYWIIHSFPRRIGVPLGLAFAALDLIEDGVLLARLESFGWAYRVSEWQGAAIPVVGEGATVLSWITSAKLGLAAGLVVFVLARDYLGGKRSAG